MSNQKNHAVNNIDEPTLDLSSVAKNAKYLETVEPVELVEPDNVELGLSAVKRQGKGLDLSSVIKNAKYLEPLEPVKPDNAELVLSAVEQAGDGNIGRNCIPGTNKIDTARRSASPAEGRVKTYDVLHQQGVRSEQQMPDIG